MPDDGILLEYRERIAVLTFNRPDKKNAFNSEMWAGLERATAQLKKKHPRVLVITGAGGVFSSGFDVNPSNPQVSELIDPVKTHSRPVAERLVRYIRGCVDGLTSLPFPIIAALNGNAFGGGAELAIRCDIRVMDPRAEICFSEVRLGLMCDWGGGVALTRLIGPSRAADLILTARRLGAEEALEIGSINRISEAGKTLEESLDMAGIISRNGPRAVRASLEVIRRTPNLPLHDALEFETFLASDLIASGECVHGVTAFLEKRDPEFPDPE
ncbi:MAG: enoyl-CoA hydratase/isomerase family protein [Spirochaetes bacterium]|jgi:enoyl-CoA hydratase/carnithine racemase|nr:enoyl-CoA hydratase/isomerase family protein [Spirochaetota bacterium]